MSISISTTPEVTIKLFKVPANKSVCGAAAGGRETPAYSSLQFRMLNKVRVQTL